MTSCGGRRGSPPLPDGLTNSIAAWLQARATLDQARAQMDAEIRTAKERGSPYSQLSEATGLSIAAIQGILGYKRKR